MGREKGLKCKWKQGILNQRRKGGLSYKVSDYSSWMTLEGEWELEPNEGRPGQANWSEGSVDVDIGRMDFGSQFDGKRQDQMVGQRFATSKT